MDVRLFGATGGEGWVVWSGSARRRKNWGARIWRPFDLGTVV